MKDRLLLRVKHKFDSAHKLNDYKGKCSQLHGHTWKIEVYIKVENVQYNGISIDFNEIKNFLKNFLPDHKYLNEELNMKYPSAENIVMHLYKGIKKTFPGLCKIVLWETESNGVEYVEL